MPPPSLDLIMFWILLSGHCRSLESVLRCNSLHTAVHSYGCNTETEVLLYGIGLTDDTSISEHDEVSGLGLSDNSLINKLRSA